MVNVAIPENESKEPPRWSGGEGWKDNPPTPVIEKLTYWMEV